MKTNILKRLGALCLLCALCSFAGAATEYGIYIGETMITSSNASDVFGNGQFSYNSSTKTLTVRNATLTNSGSLGSGISNRKVDGLKIQLIGTNTFTTRMNIINSYYSFSITGTGTLNGTSSESYCFSFYNKSMTCTIDGPKLNLSSKRYGVSDYGEKDYEGGCTLKIQGSNTSLTLTSGTNYPTIYNLKSLSLASGYYITEPAGGYFSSSLKSITTDGSTAYKGKIVISKEPAKYGLFISSTSVTSANASDILGNGQFSYSPTTKTLTLRNANFTANGGGSAESQGISNTSIDGLIINVVGTNSITAQLAPMGSMKSFSFTGTGSLTLTSTGSYGIALWSSTPNIKDNIGCTINGPRVTIISKNGSSFSGGTEDNNTVTVTGTGTRLELQPTRGGADHTPFYLMNGLTLGSGLYITEPYGCYFDTTLNDLTTDGKTVYKGRVVISSTKPTPTAYGLNIGETYVNSANASDILGNGQFSYDPATKTLTVKNANLTNNGAIGCGIDNRSVDGLVVKLVGNNVINARIYPVYSEKNFSIVGSGSLKGTSTSTAGIVLSGDCEDLTIDGPTIDITGQDYGLWDYGKKATLVVLGDGTSLTLQSSHPSNYPAIYNLANMGLGYQICITEPNDGEFNSDLRTITTDGNTAYKGKVVIKDIGGYPLWVSGTQVTTDNMDDVLGDGKVSLVNKSNSYDLNIADGALIEGGIRNELHDPLWIKFTGDCTINGTDFGISTKKRVLLTGSLKNMKAEESHQYINATNGPAILLRNSSSCRFECGLTSENQLVYTHFHLNGTTAAIKGERGDERVQFFAITYLDAGDGNVRMPALNNIGEATVAETSGFYLTKPYNGWFEPTLKSYTTDGATPYTGTVLISTEQPSEPKYYGFYVAETPVTEDNADDILGDEQFTYDAKTNTLWVGRNAHLTNHGILGTGISIRENYGLTIRIQQGATFNTRNSVISSQCSFTIFGSGTLRCKSTEGNGIYLCSDTITCNVKCDLDIIGNTFGLYDYSRTARLNIISDNVSFQSSQPDEFPAIWGLESIEMTDNIRLKEPEGGWYDPLIHSITTDGIGTYYGKVVFKRYTEYPLWIGGKQVTSFNAGDVLGDGTVLVTDESHIYLNNAKINGGIISTRERKQFLVYIKGDCEITCPEAEATASVGTGIETNSAQLNITGDYGKSTLTINAPGGRGIAINEGMECIFRKGADVTINADIAIEGNDSYMTFWDYNCRLLMNASAAAITGISGLELNGHNIAKPAGAWFDPELKTITLDGATPCSGTVLIGDEKPEKDYFSEDNSKGQEIDYHITGDETVEVIGTDETADEIDIPATAGERAVTGIGEGAFQNLASITTVWIPATMQFIGYGAFRNCSGLANVYVKCFLPPTLLNQDGNPTDDNEAFAGLPGSTSASRTVDWEMQPYASQTDYEPSIPTTLHVPYGRIEAYDKAPWNNWFNYIIDDATILGDVNLDFSVDVADIATVINVMSGNEGIAPAFADVNADGAIDVADIATIINIMATKSR